MEKRSTRFIRSDKLQSGIHEVPYTVLFSLFSATSLTSLFAGGAQHKTVSSCLCPSFQSEYDSVRAWQAQGQSQKFLVCTNLQNRNLQFKMSNSVV